MAELSIVAMTWNRGGRRVDNLLFSLLEHQSERIAEIVVVDTSNDPEISADVARACRPYHRVHLIHRPQETLRKAWALNVGIQATSPLSRWVATVDIDFIFGPYLAAGIMNTLKPRMSIFAITTALRLPEDADLDHPFVDFDAFCMQATWWGPTGGPGALQVCDRGWWFKIRGYDEIFDGGLGGMDLNIVDRARDDGLPSILLPFQITRALHQWHPTSPLKGKSEKLLKHNMPIIANPNGWGDAR